MTAATERWAEIAAVFDELVELGVAERSKRLDDLARNDPALAAEVKALLTADEQANPLLDSDAADAVPGILSRDTDVAPGDGMAGPYRLLKPLGEGGMGVVWLAERTDGAYEQQVAVKVLKRGMDTHAILRRFLMERRILARLHHPHIVRLIDGGMSADERPYYVMDYVDGQTITEYASQQGLDLRRRIDLLASVADAVAYAHTQLIVHRDLKPSNVMVDTHGKPRVLDFGIAKLIEESGEQTQTGTGMRVMSPAYAAPEQILGEPIGTATDVYALGLMLCELLVGQLPQKRRVSTPAQLMLDVSHETIERASTLAGRISAERIAELYGKDGDARQLARKLSGDLDLIIATALQREPSRRYLTAAALADDLRRWLNGRPIAARADAVSYRLARFVRRHRLGVAATVVIALSLIGGLGAALWQANRASNQAQIAQQQAARAERVKTFLISIFRQADPALNHGEPATAVDILKQGRAGLDASLLDDPATRAELLIAVAQIQLYLGEYEDGTATAELALPLLVASMHLDNMHLADAYAIRGQLYDHLDRAAEAEKDMRSAIKIFAADPVANADRLDELERDLAFVLLHTESPAAAVALESKVIHRMSRRLDVNSPRIADHRLSLALLLEDTGEYAEAEAQYRQGLPVVTREMGPLAPTVCEAEGNFAGLLDRLGKSAEAVGRFERALDCRRRLYGSDSPIYARTVFSRGILMLTLRRYSDAEADFRAALGIFGGHGNGAAHARRYLGLALTGQHLFAQAAIELAESERLYIEVDLPRDSQRWRARADYGYALFRGGDPVRGKAAIEAALAGLDSVLDDHDSSEYMLPLKSLGEVARAEGDFAAALRAHRRWHAIAVAKLGTDSNSAAQASRQLCLDLAAIGDRASLDEASQLIAAVVESAVASGIPALDEYQTTQREIAVAIANLPSR